MLPAVRAAVLSPQPEAHVVVQIAAEAPAPVVVLPPQLRLPRLLEVRMFGVL